MKKVAFQTLGCKLNFAETAGISRGLSHDEYTIVDFHEAADVYVIHSCMVTANAERKTIAAIRQAHKANEHAGIAVIGCMSELDPEKLRKESGVRWIIGNQDKYSLSEILSDRKEISPDTKPLAFFPSWSVNERTRSFLKIQDGCDYFCAYCTIPLARGRSRSAGIKEVLDAAAEIASAGLKEIVLTGVNIGDFGRHQNENLFQLLQGIRHTQGIERIRISSIEPDLLGSDIIALFSSDPVLMPHFHIPLQAGNDEVLKLMRRRYDTHLFAEKVNEIRKQIPHACIATDVITGFPGETDELFEAAFNYLSELDISYMHVFTYSERKNTKAILSGTKVPVQIRKERTTRLLQLSKEKKEKFYAGNTGRTAAVFFESENKKDYLYGFTENYIRVRIPYQSCYVNSIQKVILRKLNADETFHASIIES
jgi:threonylcarbamoyladenosine tRNA methylthiotransferase MtaB